MSSPTEPSRPGFGQALRFWWLLGWISFGGPAGQIAVMHAELVERRRWVDEASFLRGLNFCMLLPGPEAMQLATWLGWRLHGIRGGLAAGTLFVLPAAVLLAALSWAYLRHGGTDGMAGIALGLSAAVLALLVQALWRLGVRMLRTPWAAGIAVAAFVALALGALPFPLVIALAGVAGLLLSWLRPGALPVAGEPGGASPAPLHRRGHPGRAFALALALVLAWWLPLLAVRAWLGGDSTAWTMSVFFSQASLVTFGGAYAVLPYVAQQAVEQHQWLDATQMMAGLGLAETTPGPLILVLEFVGFVGGWQNPDLASPLASALLGAGVTLWATFLPSFLFVLPAAPWIEGLHRHAWLGAALAAVGAAVVGVIAQLAAWFGGHLFAAATPAQAGFAAGVALLSGLALARLAWPVPVVVGLAALAGAVFGGLA